MLHQSACLICSKNIRFIVKEKLCYTLWCYFMYLFWSKNIFETIIKIFRCSESNLTIKLFSMKVLALFSITSFLRLYRRQSLRKWGRKVFFKCFSILWNCFSEKSFPCRILSMIIWYLDFEWSFSSHNQWKRTLSDFENSHFERFADYTFKNKIQ